ncbi:hypothetical protein, unknown function [Leishmania tarentolae]|uniref:Uncharacterized protein n=1 Tax=Leishmania tarentolae TaxID=5689 RepID=A0A640KUK4_LEITA|nr:hypothetical protein, unknown function [Leishmania tarentolae]
MFRPSDDHMERMAGYKMQRMAIHNMAMMARMEEEQMLMRQMQEMEMMQMQAMGCMLPVENGQWMPPQQEQQQSLGVFHGPTGFNSVPNAAPSSVVQPSAPGAGTVSVTPQSAMDLGNSGTGSNMYPSTTTASTGPGLNDAPSMVGNFSSYALEGPQSTTPFTNDANGAAEATDTMNNANSMYGGNLNGSSPAYTGGGLNQNGASAVGYSMYNANNTCSMYEQPSPSSAATNASAAMTIPSVGAPAPHDPSKEASPPLQRKLSLASLDKRAQSSTTEDDTTSTSTTHRSRELRRKNSELKRQNSGMINSGSRGPAYAPSQPTSAERKPSFSAK